MQRLTSQKVSTQCWQFLRALSSAPSPCHAHFPRQNWSLSPGGTGRGPLLESPCPDLYLWDTERSIASKSVAMYMYITHNTHNSIFTLCHEHATRTCTYRIKETTTSSLEVIQISAIQKIHTLQTECLSKKTIEIGSPELKSNFLISGK